MKRNLLITICLVALLLPSCRKDNRVELSKSDYLVFGHFYGMCVGERCVKIFRLEKNKLFEDVRKQYPDRTRFYQGRFVELPEQKFHITRDLINYFPQDLLDERDPTIGQPDAGDWGGLYIEYNFHGTRRYWFIDKMKTNVPAKYHAFIDKVNEKIDQL